MILEGKYDFSAPREKLWEFLIDPAKIAKCLPDLKTFEVESQDRFVAVMRVGVGFVKSDFKFKLEVVEKEPVSRARIKASGSGSGNSILLDMKVELKVVPQGSELAYSTDAKVGGVMASLGQRVIKDTAEKTIAQVFECIKKQVE